MYDEQDGNDFVNEDLVYLSNLIQKQGLVFAKQLYHEAWEGIHSGYYRHVPDALRGMMGLIGATLVESLPKGSSTRCFVSSQMGILTGIFHEERNPIEWQGLLHSANSIEDHVPSGNFLEHDNLQPVHHVGDLTSFLEEMSHKRPCVIRGACSKWKSLSQWNNIEFWKSLGGQYVPVEIGSYLGENFEHRIVDLYEFMVYALNVSPYTDLDDLIYLAQYDLSSRFPELLEYISPIPDFGHLIGPCSSQNIFIGPRGTVTPLHMDPYDNFFCQVVGVKYIRLHPHEEEDNLYFQTIPSDPNDTKLPEDLTSISAETIRKCFPKYNKSAGYHVRLSPGDSLFIPRGWFHFVKSESFSISVAHFIG